MIDQPPEAVHLEISAVTDSTVTLSWTRADDQGFAGYDVYAGPDDAFDTTDSPSVEIAFSFDTTKTLRHLRPATHYFFRVFTRNESGQVSGSNIVDTTTLSSAREVFLFEPRQDSLLDTVAYVHWTQCALPDFGAYLLYVDTSESRVDTNATPQKTIELPQPGDTSAAVSGLRRGATYYFRVFVMGYFEDIIASSQVRTLTIDSTAPPPPELRVRVSAPDSAVLTWTQCTSSRFLEYRVFGSPDTGITGDGVPDTTITSAGDTSLRVGGLADTAQTRFRVFTVYKGGLASGSNEAVNYPVILRVESVNADSATLSWTASASKDFYAYKVYGDTVPDVAELARNLVRNSITDPLTTTAQVAVAGTRRYYRVFHYEKVNNQVQAGVGSNAVLVQPPPALTVTAVSSDSVVLRWSRNASPLFAAYRLYGSADTGVDNTDDLLATISRADDTVMGIGGLSDTVRTWYRVYAVYGDGAVSGSGEVTDFPVILAVDTVTSGSVALGWDAITSPEFAAYRVYADTAPEVAAIPVNLVSGSLTSQATSSVTLPGRDSAHTRYFRVYRFDNGVTAGIASNAVAVEPVPVLRAAAVGRDSVELSWTRCASSEFSEYRVYMRSDTGIQAAGIPLARFTAAGATTIKVGGLSDTVQTWFRVFVLYRNGPSYGSNEVPNYPVILSASATDTTVVLSWTGGKSGDLYACKVYTDTVENVTEASESLTPLYITDPLQTSLTHNVRETTRPRYYRVFYYAYVNDDFQAGIGSNVVVVDSL